jgi:hypothetical protein
MSWKNDVREGITADVTADREAVVAACRRATDTLGKHARLEAGPGKVTVSFLPGMSQRMSHVSPIVGVALRPAEAGRLRVDVRVERYKLNQSVMLGFIPAGPKTLVGRGQLLRFLAALETELGALDPVSGSVRRTDPLAP